MSESNTTIFEVIDNFWGRDPLSKIRRADKITLRRFGKQVNCFYESYSPRRLGVEEFRTYYGGFVAVNFSLSGKQTTFFNNLLYAHSTIVPDPIARWYFDDYEMLSKTPAARYHFARVDQSEWLGWVLNSDRAFRWNLDLSRDVLRYFVGGMLRIRPLVDAGIVVLVSQAHIMVASSRTIVEQALVDAEQSEFLSAMVEVDEKLPLWDNCRGGIMTPEVNQHAPSPASAKWAAAKEAAYYIRKNLAIADSAGGYYVPENATDYGLLRAVLSLSGQRLGISEWKYEVARNLRELRIPSLEGVPLSELVSIRKNTEAFEQFRNWLARQLLTSDVKQAPAILELTAEEFHCELERMREQLRSSSVIKKYIKEDGLRIVVGALTGMASATAIGNPLAGAAAGALAGVANSLLKRDRLASDNVFAQLAQMNRVAADATYGREGKPSGLPAALSQPFLGEVQTGPNPDESIEYTPKRLRDIVTRSLNPSTYTGGPYHAISARQ